jgi:hypothetical protein
MYAGHPGHGHGPNVQNAFANWRALGDYIQDTGLLGALVTMERGNEDAAQFLNSLNLGDLVTFVNLGFAGMTGLNLETDVLGGWTATSPSICGNSEDILPIAGQRSRVETSDLPPPERLRPYGRSLRPVSRDLLANRHGLSTLVIPNASAVIPPEAREREGWRQLDVLMGTSSEVFAMGTRAGCSSA